VQPWFTIDAAQVCGPFRIITLGWEFLWTFLDCALQDRVTLGQDIMLILSLIWIEVSDVANVIGTVWGSVGSYTWVWVINFLACNFSRFFITCTILPFPLQSPPLCFCVPSHRERFVHIIISSCLFISVASIYSHFQSVLSRRLWLIRSHSDLKMSWNTAACMPNLIK
jgi:hypothetical protein